MILLLKNIIRGGLISAMDDRCVKSDENKKIMNIDANSLYVHSMSQPWPYDGIKFDRNYKLEDTPDVSDIGYFVEIDSFYPDNIELKNKNFPLCS